jgi:hypothetical protein
MSGGAPPDLTAPQVIAQPIRSPPLFYPDPNPWEALQVMMARLSDIECAWDWDRQNLMGESAFKAWIYLTLVSDRALGYDEQRTRDNSTNGGLDFNLCGQRIITINVRCESMDQQVRSHDILERVRWCQRSTLAQTLRDEQHLALVNYGDTRILGRQTNRDGHWVDVATLEITFARALNAPEPGRTYTDYIQTVDGDPQIPGTPFTIPGNVSGEEGGTNIPGPGPGGGPQRPDDSSIAGTGSLGNNQVLGIP